MLEKLMCIFRIILYYLVISITISILFLFTIIYFKTLCSLFFYILFSLFDYLSKLSKLLSYLNLFLTACSKHYVFCELYLNKSEFLISNVLYSRLKYHDIFDYKYNERVVEALKETFFEFYIYISLYAYFFPTDPLGLDPEIYFYTNDIINDII
jgi:hypothetical protein